MFGVPSKRVTITLPEDLVPRVQELADDARTALATYVTRVVEHHVLNQEGLTAMEIAITGFELLVAVLQAFIFTILTAVYIGGSLHPEH